MHDRLRASPLLSHASKSSGRFGAVVLGPRATKKNWTWSKHCAGWSTTSAFQCYSGYYSMILYFLWSYVLHQEYLEHMSMWKCCLEPCRIMNVFLFVVCLGIFINAIATANDSAGAIMAAHVICAFVVCCLWCGFSSCYWCCCLTMSTACCGL